MENQTLLLKSPKTNWKYIIIVVILAAIVGGGILVWRYWLAPPRLNLSTSKYVCRNGSFASIERLDKNRELSLCLDCVMKSAYMCGDKFWIYEYGGIPGSIVNRWSGPYNIERLQEFKEALIPPTEIKDETANWKTYRNEEHGFEVKYPENWTIKEETKQNVGSIKENYRLDIFHPENITEADVWGNIAVGFYVLEDNKKFFDQQLDLMKRQLDLTTEEITINGVKGFKGTAYQKADKAESMYVSQLFWDKENQGVFRISVWTIDSDKKTYQEQANLILSTFKFLE